MAVEDITNGNENELGDSFATSTIPLSKKDLAEEGHLYADQNGNENAVRDENEIRDSVSLCNIPCRKIENTNLYDKNVMQCELPDLMVCHVVKEICIDDGMPWKDKIVVDNESGNGLCTVLPFEKNQNGDVTREREDSESLSSTGSKSSFENVYNEDDIQEWGTKEKQVDKETLLSDALKSLLENRVADDIGNDGTVKVRNDVPRGKSLKSLFEYDDSDGYEEVQWQSDQVGSDRIRHENDISAVGRGIQGQGESSFSMACPVSGPMTYSSSVSLRSDSSTTSTRSFAFPMIQSEWNSSPIRMAKADRKHYRKHRGWRAGLLCFRL